nr:unnamed protein product [Digitaria exilis]
MMHDASPCTHVLLLKQLCLLDAIHATYIRALAVLPSCSPRLLRALLVAGHCYGPMDLVPNIVVSTAWYDMAFPLAEPDQQLPQGILDTRPVYRLASRSLQGLVAMASATCGCRSTHESLELLHSLDCDLSRCHGTTCSSSSSISYAATAKTAKHPQHAAFGSFLASLTNDKLARLSCVLPADGGVISEAQWRQLNTILDEQSFSEPLPHHLTAPICLLSPSGSVHVSNKKFYFKAKLDFEPSYQVDIVCGVWQSNASFGPNVYHANFLANTDAAAGNAMTLPHERTLFFAEFWKAPSPEDV